MVKTLEGMVAEDVLLSQLPFLDGETKKIPEKEKEKS